MKKRLIWLVILMIVSLIGTFCLNGCAADPSASNNEESAISNIEESEINVDNEEEISAEKELKLGEKIITDSFEFTLQRVDVSSGKLKEYPPVSGKLMDRESCGNHVSMHFTMKNIGKVELSMFGKMAAHIDYNDGYIFDFGEACFRIWDGDRYTPSLSHYRIRLLPLKEKHFVWAVNSLPDEVITNTVAPLSLHITLPDGEKLYYVIRE